MAMKLELFEYTCSIMSGVGIQMSVLWDKVQMGDFVSELLCYSGGWILRCCFSFYPRSCFGYRLGVFPPCACLGAIDRLYMVWRVTHICGLFVCIVFLLLRVFPYGLHTNNICWLERKEKNSNMKQCVRYETIHVFLIIITN